MENNMKLRGFFVIDCKMFPNKNPKGYTRTTQKSKWSNNSVEYEQWKEHVAKCFRRQCDGVRSPLKEKIKLKMRIFYFNDHKSDPSNVYKGIEDALADKKILKNHFEERLFKNDNYVIGEFDFFYCKESPRVEVEIYF